MNVEYLRERANVLECGDKSPLWSRLKSDDQSPHSKFCIMDGFQETANTGIRRGSPVIIYLHTPREKLWGLVLEINAAGVFLRGIDLNTFEDWTQMLAKGERNIGLNYVFFPMWRIERIALDERIDDIPSLADKFQERVGLSIDEYFSK